MAIAVGGEGVSRSEETVISVPGIGRVKSFTLDEHMGRIIPLYNTCRRCTSFSSVRAVKLKPT